MGGVKKGRWAVLGRAEGYWERKWAGDDMGNAASVGCDCSACVISAERRQGECDSEGASQRSFLPVFVHENERGNGAAKGVRGRNLQHRHCQWC